VPQDEEILVRDAVSPIACFLCAGPWPALTIELEPKTPRAEDGPAQPSAESGSSRTKRVRSAQTR
jgi:hypothetical protein